MDWFCRHGHQNHFDGDSAYEVLCETCEEVYKLYGRVLPHLQHKRYKIGTSPLSPTDGCLSKIAFQWSRGVLFCCYYNIHSFNDIFGYLAVGGVVAGCAIM
jgi:hypothetical protein